MVVMVVRVRVVKKPKTAKNRQKPPKTAKKRLTSMFGEFSSVVEGAIAQASILVGFENFRFF